jgi:hypothetical protein
VSYSISVSGQDENLITVNVAGMPNCQNIIRAFYMGNVLDDPFPFTRYVNYFQFGIISNEVISDTHWQVNVSEPRMLIQTGWTLVDQAWSLEGDHSYLDYNLMWGGATYPGVDAQHYPLQNPYEIIFYYDGDTLPAGTVLWDVPATNNGTITYSMSGTSALTTLARRSLPAITTVLGLAILLPFVLARRRRKKNLRLFQISNTRRYSSSPLRLSS